MVVAEKVFTIEIFSLYFLLLCENDLGSKYFCEFRKTDTKMYNIEAMNDIRIYFITECSLLIRSFESRINVSD